MGAPVSLLDASNVVQAGGRVLAIEGTGGTADRIAATLAGERDDGELEALTESGLVEGARGDSPRLADLIEERLRSAGTT